MNKAGDARLGENSEEVVVTERSDVPETMVPCKEIGLKAVVKHPGCYGCGACTTVCTPGAITVDLWATVDPDKCTGCGLCVLKCAVGAISMQ